MAEQDPLATLISSLSSHERRKLVNLHEQSQRYLGKKTANAELYLLIHPKGRKKGPQTTSEIKSAAGKFPWAKNLAVTKQRLREEILTILVGEDTDPAQHLAGLVARARVLRQRGLPAEALKVVEKGLVQAEQHEEFHVQLNLIKLKSALMKGYQLEAYSNIESLKGTHTITSKISEVLQANACFQKMLTAIGQNDMKAVLEIRAEALQDLTLCTTASSHVLLLRTLSNASYFLSDLRSCFEYYSKLISTIDDSWHKLKTHPEILIEYSTMLFTMGEIALNLGEKKVFNSVLEGIERLEASSKIEQARNWAFVAQLKLHHGIVTGNTTAIRSASDQIQKGYSAYAHLIAPRMKSGILTYLGLGEFMVGNYSASVKWLHPHFKIPSHYTNLRITSGFLITFLTSHWHLGNLETISKARQSIEKYLGGISKANPLLEVVMDYLEGKAKGKKLDTQEYYSKIAAACKESPHTQYLLENFKVVTLSLGLMP